jgi:hypothetical protein
MDQDPPAFRWRMDWRFCCRLWLFNWHKQGFQYARSGTRLHCLGRSSVHRVSIGSKLLGMSPFLADNLRLHCSVTSFFVVRDIHQPDRLERRYSMGAEFGCGRSDGCKSWPTPNRRLRLQPGTRCRTIVSYRHSDGRGDLQLELRTLYYPLPILGRSSAPSVTATASASRITRSRLPPRILRQSSSE